MRIRIRPKFWLFAIMLMLIVFSTSFAIAQHSHSESRKALAEAIAKREMLRSQVQELETKLEFAQTDDFVIRMARDELSMIMPGEIRYISGN